MPQPLGVPPLETVSGAPVVRAVTLVPIFLSLALAAPPPGRAQGDGVDRRLREAQSLVAQAARLRAEEAERARGLADRAFELLLPLTRDGGAPCDVLVAAVEAGLRAGRPGDCRTVLNQASALGCDPAAVNHLLGWLLEHGRDGTRRGPGAALLPAMQAYERAAEALAEREGADPALLAGALGSAAELAELRGSWGHCATLATRGLAASPPRGQRLALGLSFLRCRARLIGEGAALGELAAQMEEGLVLDLVQARLSALRRRLDAGHDDAFALAAVATYGLITGEAAEAPNALRYLLTASSLEPRPPDLDYLLGRASEALGHVGDAEAHYRSQLAAHPDQPASRLAANALALLLASLPAGREELVEALALVDAELAATPEEAALHDTRAHVLLALDRRAEARAALQRAVALSDDPAFRLALERLEREP